MSTGFNIRDYKTFDELFFHASTELTPNNLLYVRKFAHSASLTANAVQDIWNYGGTQTLITTAGTVSCVSSSANDAVNGTGAWYLQLVGLDADYNPLTETVTLTGTTPVVSTASFLRVNTMRSVYHGSNKANVGNITATIGAVVANYIDAGEGIDQSSHYTIPAGYTAFVQSSLLTVYRVSGGSSAARRAEIDLKVYIPAANANYETIRYGVSTDGGAFVSTNSLLSQTPAKSTVWFTATADTTGTVVTSAMNIVLVKEDLNFRTEV